ncbi:MAG: tyrosine-type recombinase/integrase [Lactovum sp.]
MIDKIVEDMYIFGDLSYDYTKKVVITLHQIFDFAIDKGYLSENPINRYKINIKSEDKEKQRNKQKYKYLEKNEVTKILDYFSSKESTYWLHARATEFLYLTGMRFGEMAALQWKNFDGKSVKVNGTLDYRNRRNSEVAKFNTTKTAAGNRTVDLTDRLIEILDEIKSAQIFMFGKVEKDNFIFRNSDGFPISIYTLNKALKSAAEHKEIDKTVTSHIFRHSHVSLLAEMNLPLKSIMERIGHSDASTTLKIYNHVTRKAKQDVLDALNKI